jgi:hypothetical protein
MRASSWRSPRATVSVISLTAVPARVREPTVSSSYGRADVGEDAGVGLVVNFLARRLARLPD